MEIPENDGLLHVSCQLCVQSGVSTDVRDLVMACYLEISRGGSTYAMEIGQVVQIRPTVAKCLCDISLQRIDRAM